MNDPVVCEPKFTVGNIGDELPKNINKKKPGTKKR